MAKNKVHFKFDTKQLADLLKANETDFAKREKALERAMRRTMNPIREDMNAGAPVDYGILSKSHRTSRIKRNKAAVAVRTGPSSGMGRSEGVRQRLAGWRAHFVEFGTQHHKGTGYLDRAITKHWSSIRNRLADELAKEYKKLLRKYSAK